MKYKFKKGYIPWNKGKKGLFHHSKEFKDKMSEVMRIKSVGNKNNLGNKLSRETKKKISIGNKGKILSKETKERISLNSAKYWLGKKRSSETIDKIRKANCGKVGEKCGNWKGGITPLNKLLRNSSQATIWRESVFLRDNFICKNKNCKYCKNKQGVMLHAHHIKPFSKYPELRFEINNGITYCKEFHLKSGMHKNIKKNI